MSNPPGQPASEWPSHVAHTGEYAVLAILVARWARPVFPGQRVRVIVLGAWLLAAAYAASDEFHQSFVPNRDASPFDWAFDVWGAALGLLIWRLVLALEGTRRTPS